MAALDEHSASAADRALKQAYRLAVELGADPLRQEIVVLARRARIGLGTPPAEAAPTASPASTSRQDRPGAAELTEREQQVLQCLAEGNSNRQIARELFITEKTASVHVSNILMKLSAASRGEAAAIAIRLGLVTTNRPESLEERWLN
jgi:DNA-binding NarL/FixJ family response regulator